MLRTAKPLTKKSANRMIMAFMINKNKPSVTTVTGKVSTTNIGLTINLSNANTTATIIAETYPETSTPGSTYAKTITATAVSKSFKIQFISFMFDLKI